MSTNYDIEMSLNDTLEIDTIIKNSSDALDPINRVEHIKSGSNSNHKFSGIQTSTGIFKPQESGLYEIDVNNQTLSIKVTDPSNIPNTPVAQSYLIAWYPFENQVDDETAGISEYGDTTDYSGSVNGATQVTNKGVTDILTQSKDSKAYEFDGSTEDIDLQVNNLHNKFLSQPISVTFWMYNNDSTQNSKMFDVFVNRWNISINLRKSGIYFNVYDGTDYEAGANNTFENEWLFVAATHGSDDMKYYENSTLRDTISGVSSAKSNTPVGPHIGSATGEVDYFDGKLDDIRIYNKELTSQEISSIYDATKP